MRDATGQMDTLLGLYREMGDEQLLRMWETSEDLTEVAREALAQVMRERGQTLAPPHAEPEDATQYDAERHGVQVSGGEAPLWTFGDAFLAREAIGLLNDAGIWHRIADQTRSTDEGLSSRVLVGLMVIVLHSDYSAAVELLREKMGLFPRPEVDNAGGSPLSNMDGAVLLAMYSREDALLTAEALGRAGISYWWRDGSEETQELPDEATVAIEVSAKRLGEAQAAVETLAWGR